MRFIAMFMLATICSAYAVRNIDQYVRRRKDETDTTCWLYLIWVPILLAETFICMTKL